MLASILVVSGLNPIPTQFANRFLFGNDVEESPSVCFRVVGRTCWPPAPNFDVGDVVSFRFLTPNLSGNLSRHGQFPPAHSSNFDGRLDERRGTFKVSGRKGNQRRVNVDIGL